MNFPPNDNNNSDKLIAHLEQLKNESDQIRKEIDLLIQNKSPKQNISILQEKRKQLWEEIQQLEKSLNIQPDEFNTIPTSTFSQNATSSLFLNNDNNNLQIDDTNGKKETENELNIASKLDEINQNIFHHDSFRNFQKEAIQSAVEGNDVLVIAPTGFGKSLIYQIAGLYDHKLTIAISPLISLIQDQIRSLLELRINSAAFLSKIGNSDYFDALKKIENDEFFFLFLTPEKIMQSEHLCNFLVDMHKLGKIARIVIDEAQCISQFGHDFRPDYRNLKLLRDKFVGIHFLALTSTATETVANDIQHELQMDNCKTFRMSFNRSNIIYQVYPKKDSISTYQEILHFISEHNYEDQSGLIYCTSSRETELLSDFLNKNGLSSCFYHAKITNPKKRFEVQKQWSNGEIKIAVATIAFGLGIDKSDVRFVIHFSIPKSIEFFYQESGRAGRDGKCAYSLLFYNQSDCVRMRKCIFTIPKEKPKTPSIENDTLVSHSDSEVDSTTPVDDVVEPNATKESPVQYQKKLFESIENFCNNVSICRREFMLRYFGEEFDRINCHERCDVCERIERDTEKICKINMTQACQEICLIIQSIYQNRPDAPPYPTVCYLVSVYLGDNKGAIRMSKDMNIPQYGRGIHFKNRVKTLYCVFPILVDTGILISSLKESFHGTITYYIPGVNFDEFIKVGEKFSKIEIDYQVPKIPAEMNYNEFLLYKELISIRDSIVNSRGNYPSNFMKYSTLKKIVKEKPNNKNELRQICLSEVTPKALDLFSSLFLKEIRKFKAEEEQEIKIVKQKAKKET